MRVHLFMKAAVIMMMTKTGIVMATVIATVIAIVIVMVNFIN